MSIMEKPRVVDKLHKYRRNLRKNGGKVGRTPRQVAIDYNNACNFRCEFCYEVGEANIIPSHLVSKILRGYVMKRMPLVSGRSYYRVENY